MVSLHCEWDQSVVKRVQDWLQLMTAKYQKKKLRQ